MTHDQFPSFAYPTPPAILRPAVTFDDEVVPIYPQWGLYVTHTRGCIGVKRFLANFKAAWKCLPLKVKRALKQYWSAPSADRQTYGRYVLQKQDGEPVMVLVDGPRVEYRVAPNGPHYLYGACRGGGHYLTFDADDINPFGNSTLHELGDWGIQSVVGYTFAKAYLRTREWYLATYGAHRAKEYDALDRKWMAAQLDAYEVWEFDGHVHWADDVERVAAAERETNCVTAIEHSLVQLCRWWGFGTQPVRGLAVEPDDHREAPALVGAGAAEDHQEAPVVLIPTGPVCLVITPTANRF
jgi:hypothetical protein